MNYWKTLQPIAFARSTPSNGDRMALGNDTIVIPAGQPVRLLDSKDGRKLIQAGVGHMAVFAWVNKSDVGSIYAE